MAVLGHPCRALLESCITEREKRSAVRLPPRQGAFKVSRCKPASVLMCLKLGICRESICAQKSMVRGRTCPSRFPSQGWA